MGSGKAELSRPARANLSYFALLVKLAHEKIFIFVCGALESTHAASSEPGD
jgi:hypothetical protein